jgi:hypothetical protein
MGREDDGEEVVEAFRIASRPEGGGIVVCGF